MVTSFIGHIAYPPSVASGYQAINREIVHPGKKGNPPVSPRFSRLLTRGKPKNAHVSQYFYLGPPGTFLHTMS